MPNDEDLTSKRISSAMRALPRDRFIEMSAISLGVAVISFGIGFLVKQYFGLEL